MELDQINPDSIAKMIKEQSAGTISQLLTTGTGCVTWGSPSPSIVSDLQRLNEKLQVYARQPDRRILIKTDSGVFAVSERAWYSGDIQLCWSTGRLRVLQRGHELMPLPDESSEKALAEKRVRDGVRMLRNGEEP